MMITGSDKPKSMIDIFPCLKKYFLTLVSFFLDSYYFLYFFAENSRYFINICVCVLFCKCSPPFRGLLRSKNWKLSKNKRVIIHGRWDVAQFWRTPLTDGCTFHYHFEFWKFYLLKLKKSNKSQTTKYTPFPSKVKMLQPKDN